MTVGVLVGVSAPGSVAMGEGPEFWAAPFELPGEFGGLGPGRPDPAMEPQDGMARTIEPAHTLRDVDLVFSLSTGQVPLADAVRDGFALSHAAACCLARAVARAGSLAEALPGDLQPSWQSHWGARHPHASGRTSAHR